MASKRVAQIIVSLTLLSLAGCQKQTTPAADVWAVVNGKEIRREEVEKYYRTRVNPEGQEPSHEEALSFELNVLDELINNEILFERARKLGLEAADGEVEDKFTESKSPYTEDEFQRQLKERGVSVDDLKQNLRRQLSIQKLLNREVVAKVTITDKDVTDFYAQNRAQFNLTEPLYRISQILVSPWKDPQVRNRKNDDAATEADARRKVAALLERLDAGADFAQVAMDYSEDPMTAASGGDLGYIPESALRQQKTDPALRAAVLSMRPGETSKVIPIREGFAILKLVSREPAGQRQLSDPQVQQTIRDTLRNRKEQLLRAAYLALGRDEAKVVNYLARQVMESSGKLPATTPVLPSKPPEKSTEKRPAAPPGKR